MDIWPTLGEDACEFADAPVNLTNASSICHEPGITTASPTAEDDCADRGCVYTAAPISVWAVITLSCLPLIPIVWFLTNPRTRPPAHFKMFLLSLSFLSSVRD